MTYTFSDCDNWLESFDCSQEDFVGDFASKRAAFKSHEESIKVNHIIRLLDLSIRDDFTTFAFAGGEAFGQFRQHLSVCRCGHGTCHSGLATNSIFSLL